MDGSKRSLVFFFEKIKKIHFMFQDIRNKYFSSAEQIAYNLYVLSYQKTDLLHESFLDISEKNREYFLRKPLFFQLFPSTQKNFYLRLYFPT